MLLWPLRFALQRRHSYLAQLRLLACNTTCSRLLRMQPRRRKCGDPIMCMRRRMMSMPHAEGVPPEGECCTVDNKEA